MGGGYGEPKVAIVAVLSFRGDYGMSEVRIVTFDSGYGIFEVAILSFGRRLRWF